MFDDVAFFSNEADDSRSHVGDGHGHGHGYVDRNVGSQQFIAGFSIVFFASVLMPFVYMVFSSDSDIIYYGWRVVYWPQNKK